MRLQKYTYTHTFIHIHTHIYKHIHTHTHTLNLILSYKVYKIARYKEFFYYNKPQTNRHDKPQTYRYQTRQINIRLNKRQSCLISCYVLVVSKFCRFQCLSVKDLSCTAVVCLWSIIVPFFHKKSLYKMIVLI